MIRAPKNNPKEVVTFHSGGSKMNWKTLPKRLNRKLYDLLEIIHWNYNTSKPNQKLHGNQFRTLPILFYFSTMKPLWQVHMPERAKLINYKGKLMKCVNFKKRNLLMKYKVCNLRGWTFWMKKISIRKFW